MYSAINYPKYVVSENHGKFSSFDLVLDYNCKLKSSDKNSKRNSVFLKFL